MKTLKDLYRLTKKDANNASKHLTLERVKVLNRIECRLGIEDEEKEIAILLNREEVEQLTKVFSIEKELDYGTKELENDKANKEFNKDYIQQRDSYEVDKSIEIGRGK